MEMFLILLGIAAGGVATYVYMSARTRQRPAQQQSPDEQQVPAPKPPGPESPRSLRDPLTDALELIDHGVVVVDGRGVEIFRNSAAVDVAEARDGRSLVESRIQELVVEALDGRTKRSTVELFGPPARFFEVSAFPVRIGSGNGALAMIEDRTEFRRTETTRRDFVANISHELKSPIGALGLLAETLVDEEDPELRRRLAGRMVSETSRAASTIDDLLELSRIEFGEDAKFEDQEVAAVVAEAVGRIEHAADQAGVGVIVTGESGLLINGDRRQLTSAIYNLLENSVKYSESGSCVEVGFDHDSNRRVVEIVVADQGVGIPRRDLDRVFERFYRVDPARSRNTGGTGLGLAIVRHVAANHGGKVSASSVEGQGSRFVLDLPMRVTPSADMSDTGGAQ